MTDNYLETLEQAIKTAQERVEKDPNTANLEALEKANRMLAERMAGEKEPSFGNRTKVLDYLNTEGYKIGKSKLYGGKFRLKIQADGSVFKSDVDDYIKRSKLIKPAEIETKGVSVELDLKKKKKENEKLTLQVSELEYKLGIIKGDYILKAETETTFAIKIGALEAGLKFLVTTKAIDYVKALKDDPTGKAWIDMIFADIDELFHEFGIMDELNIIIEKNGYTATA